MELIFIFPGLLSSSEEEEEDDAEDSESEHELVIDPAPSASSQRSSPLPPATLPAAVPPLNPTPAHYMQHQHN